MLPEQVPEVVPFFFFIQDEQNLRTSLPCRNFYYLRVFFDLQFIICRRRAQTLYLPFLMERLWWEVEIRYIFKFCKSILHPVSPYSVLLPILSGVKTNIFFYTCQCLKTVETYTLYIWQTPGCVLYLNLEIIIIGFIYLIFFLNFLT